MKKAVRVLVVIFGVILFFVIIVVLLTPWMDRWGATDEENSAKFLGDDLVLHPSIITNRAITINAPPDKIYPWILQLGAEHGGFYSYTFLESLFNCPIVNADKIHSEWQNLKVGDQVKMCPGSFGPPPYQVALVEPLYSIVLGHNENNTWSDVWQFVIEPKPDGTSRLIVRTRTNLSGGIWDMLHPAIFIMERGMLYGIKERAEKS